MKLGYFLREGISGLFRAKLASFVAVTIICIALSLVGFFLVVTLNLSALISEMRSRVELEAFLDRSFSDDRVRTLDQELRLIPEIESIHFISKAEAAKILREVMGDQDLFDLVETNPLPASFRIRLKEPFRTLEHVERIAIDIESLEGVEEVNYQKEMLRALDRQVQIYHRIVLGLGILAALAAVFLISNTIKLSIYSKRDLIRTMKLVGATHSFIAGPFLIEGILQGIIGGLAAAGITYGVLVAVKIYLISNLQNEQLTYGLLVGAGAFLGLLGSVLSVRFFLKERISDL